MGATKRKSGRPRKQDALANVTELKQTTEDFPDDIILGWEVFWTIAATTKSVSDMEQLIDSTLGPAFMPRQPQNKVKLARAMRAISETGKVRRIKEADNMIYYALIDEVPDEVNIDINLEKIAIAAYDKQKDELSFRGGSHESQQKIRAMFERVLLEYDEFQIRQVAADFINAQGAVRLRKDGKIYFIRTRRDVDALASYVALLNSGSEFYDLPIANISIAKKHMAKMIRVGLETEIEELAEEVKRMAGSKFTRGQTIVDRMKAFKETRQKCEMYADLLKTDAELLVAKVDELRNEVQQAVDGDIKEYPQAVEFPLGATIEYSGAKTDKFGTSGKVLGYFTSPSGKYYVKVKFDKSKTISPCSLVNLKIVSPPAVVS